MLPARFLTLDLYRSWVEGRSAQIIFSTDLTVHCNLHLFCLVAKPDSDGRIQDRLDDGKVEGTQQLLQVKLPELRLLTDRVQR